MKPIFKLFVVFILAPGTVLLTIPPLTALAGPPAPVTFLIVQPDGSRFEARTWGDESSNGTETVTGYTILQDAQTRYWLYAEVDNLTGQLRATSHIVGKDPPPPGSYKARPDFIAEQDQVGFDGPVRQATIPILILLVQYNNQLASTTEADWQATFFGPTHSVKDYYREVSYNQLDLIPAAENCGTTPNNGITGWLTLETTHPNAGGPSIARAALKAADPCIDYASFDGNGDGAITAVELMPIIIVAGYEESYGGAVALTPNVWGHQSSVHYRSVSDDVTIVAYCQFGERHAAMWDAPGHRATIGLIVHEIGHLLGWPDLYDTFPPGNSESEGVGDWSVMATGLWLGGTYPGDTPAHPSAWEKWYQGWLAPLQLQGANLNRTIPRIEDNKSGSAIQLRDNPNGVDWRYGESSGIGEYFLVENRQKIGYDARLPGCGLLIWHIDESITFQNRVNGDEHHKLVDLEEADGFDHLDRQLNRGDGGDPYPGTSNRTDFNTASYPNSKLYNNSGSGISITQISPGCADLKQATFTTLSVPNLNISIEPSPNPIAATTTTIIYLITFQNIGDVDATGVTITNTIPTSTSYVTGSATHGGAETALNSGVIRWPPTTIAAGSSITRSFQVTVKAPLKKGDKLVNMISLSSTQELNIGQVEQVEIVGVYFAYLPALWKDD